MNTQLLLCINVNEQMVKLGKYFTDFNWSNLEYISRISIIAVHDLPRNTAKFGRRKKFPFNSISGDVSFIICNHVLLQILDLYHFTKPRIQEGYLKYVVLWDFKCMIHIYTLCL